ncbi:sensor histidine kinase [Nocardioides bruguierae]|uniref:sensor histidine kinase n=1 Tax=Nocardioides bruguierae TaxID=2945102 RepID=UPI002021FA23|nr:HAMP domain-containing sensor histidine kinase [Nocardioides bruguierae]MCL8024790.1 HAMP domain-containing histidine kinase [Nocardioides bruguierae]
MNPALHRLMGLVVALVVVGVVSVVLSAQALSGLTGSFQPAVAAHAGVLQDVTAIDAAVGDWARTGDPAKPAEVADLRERLAGHLLRVRAGVGDDAELLALVEAEAGAAETWLDDYVEPRLALPGARYRPALYAVGQDRLADVEQAHQSTTSALAAGLAEAEAAATWRQWGAVGSLLVLAVLAVWVLVTARRSLLTRLSTPLLELEACVQRMAADPTVRARPAGPREVRSIALAVNELAEAQARARAVESHIQSSLHTLDSARDDFVSNVSHELRTPLTTIAGYLELVAEEFEGRMQPRHERILDATRRNVGRLKALIDDLLTLSRAETVRTEREASDLATIVRDAVTDVRITAAGRDIRVVMDEPAGTVPTLVDRALMGRALLNIVSNAVKFSRPDSNVEVSVVALPDDQVAAVTVTDHGIGIPEDEVERLGTRFFRARNAVQNEIAGTGLGLRIVQTVVDRHGGDLRLSSVEGQGTTVVLRVPLLRAGVLPEPGEPTDDGQDALADPEEAGAAPTPEAAEPAEAIEAADDREDDAAEDVPELRLPERLDLKPGEVSTGGGERLPSTPRAPRLEQPGEPTVDTPPPFVASGRHPG